MNTDNINKMIKCLTYVDTHNLQLNLGHYAEWTDGECVNNTRFIPENLIRDCGSSACAIGWWNTFAEMNPPMFENMITLTVFNICEWVLGKSYHDSKLRDKVNAIFATSCDLNSGVLYDVDWLCDVTPKMVIKKLKELLQ